MPPLFRQRHNAALGLLHKPSFGPHLALGAILVWDPWFKQRVTHWRALSSLDARSPYKRAACCRFQPTMEKERLPTGSGLLFVCCCWCSEACCKKKLHKLLVVFRRVHANDWTVLRHCWTFAWFSQLSYQWFLTAWWRRHANRTNLFVCTVTGSPRCCHGNRRKKHYHVVAKKLNACTSLTYTWRLPKHTTAVG